MIQVKSCLNNIIKLSKWFKLKPVSVVLSYPNDLSWNLPQ